MYCQLKNKFEKPAIRKIIAFRIAGFFDIKILFLTITESEILNLYYTCFQAIASIAFAVNSAVPPPPALSILLLKRSSEIYILPKFFRISSVQV